MGNRKEFEVEIIVNELPLTSLDYLKKNYPSNKILEVARIKDDKNKLTYEAEIRKKGKNFDIIFDASGKFTKIVDGQ